MMSLLLQRVLQLQLILWLIVVLCNLSSEAESSSYAMPGCSDSCGNVTVPYPFGIGAGCYYNKSYEITCNGSYNPPMRRAFLHQLNLEVLDISLEHINNGASQMLRVNMMPKSICTSGSSSEASPSLDLRGTPYRFSYYNTFVAMGCSGGIVVRDGSSTSIDEEAIITSCVSECPDNRTNDLKRDCCYGIGCCTAALTQNIDFYNISILGNSRKSGADSKYACNTTVVAFTSQVEEVFYSDRYDLYNPVPTYLLWNFAADHLPRNSDLNNFTCYPGSGCYCNLPFEGNPYVPNGCQGGVNISFINCMGYRWSQDAHYCKIHQSRSLAAILLSVGVHKKNKRGIEKERTGLQERSSFS